MRWKEYYERTTVRELEMVNLLPWDVQAGEINTFVLELQLFLQESDRQLNDIHVKVGCVAVMVIHSFQTVVGKQCRPRSDSSCVEPDQTAPEGSGWSGSTLLGIPSASFGHITEEQIRRVIDDNWRIMFVSSP